MNFDPEGDTFEAMHTCNSLSGKTDPRCPGCDYCLNPEPMRTVWANYIDNPERRDV